MPARILIIEDNPASLELLRYLLSGAGHSTTSASDGATGLALALEAQHDLILCDLQLPEMDGIELVRRLKAANPAAPPIVAVTAYSMPGDQEAAIAAGFDGYLTKPIDPETLLQEVDKYLPAGRPKPGA